MIKSPEPVSAFNASSFLGAVFSLQLSRRNDMCHFQDFIYIFVYLYILCAFMCLCLIIFVFIFEPMFSYLCLYTYIYTFCIYIFTFICLYLTLLKQCTFKHALATKEFSKKMFNALDYFIEDSGH